MDKLNIYIDSVCSNLAYYIKQNAILILFALACGFAAYGYELCNFSLSIDEEFKSFSNEVPLWIVEGRWLTYFLCRFFMPESMMPFLPILIAILFLVVASLIVAHSLCDDNIVKATFCAIFITFPSSAHFMEFNTYNFAVAFGIAITAIAGFLLLAYLRNSDTRLLLLSIILLTLSLGVYQGIISAWISLIALYAFNYSISNSESKMTHPLRVYIFGAVILALAMMFYKTTDFFVKWLYHASPSQYLDQYVGWAKSDVAKVISNVINSMSKHLIGKAFYGEKTIIFAWILLPILIGTAVMNRKFKSISLVIISFVILILSPFSMSLFLGAPSPIRSMIGLPIMIGGVWYGIAQINSSAIRVLVFVAALAVAYTNSFSITRLFYSDYLVSQADRDLANRVIERISLLDVKLDRNDPVTVAFIGCRPPPQNHLFIQSEIFGASFFNFAAPNQTRIYSFMKTLGIEGVRPPNKEQMKKALAFSRDLKVWPHSKSINYIDDMVIVKLSTPTDRQLAESLL